MKLNGSQIIAGAASREGTTTFQAKDPAEGTTLEPGFAEATQGEMKRRLRELGLSTAGGRVQLWRRLVRGEQARVDEQQHERRDADAEARARLCARAPTMPANPSVEERRQHMLSHLPFAAWCEDCVRGNLQQLRKW